MKKVRRSLLHTHRDGPYVTFDPAEWDRHAGERRKARAERRTPGPSDRKRSRQASRKRCARCCGCGGCRGMLFQSEK